MANLGDVRATGTASRSAVSALALTVLTTVLGFQLLRVFIPTLLFYLGEVVGVSTVGLGGVGLVVFLAGAVLASFERLLGLRRALALAAGGTAVLRAAEQFSGSPPLDFALSVGGVVLFLMFVPVALGGVRAGGRPRVTGFALALLLGVAADSVLHIAAGTYDLKWQDGVWPALIVIALALSALVALIGAVGSLPRRAVAVSWRRAWPLLAFGPWLALQLIVLQNVARTAAVTGWSLPAAGFVVTAGNVFGLVGAALPAARASRGAALVAAGALVLVSLPTVAEGVVAALLVVTGQTLAAVLLARALSASVPAEPAGEGLGRTAVAFGFGQLLLTLFFFAYNAPHSLALPFTEVMVVPFMALFVALTAVLAPAGEKQAPRLAVRPLLVASALLLLAPAAVALTWQTPRLAAPATPADSLRVLDYNLHNGFDVTGRLDIEALAVVIEESGADVVTLQEVSRGWVVAGSLDMLAWLAHRLDMVVASGPTMSDRQWGNAILSRYPMVAAKASSLPSEGLPLQRGYLQAEVDTGGTPVRVISLHLHHVAGEGEVREVQVDALLQDLEAGRRTIIAGDFNAKPESEEIRMLVDAGLVDLGATLGEEPGYTSPAEAPVQRIDYIFSSPDLAPEAFWLLETTASDHLPLLAVVRLPED